MRIDYEIIADDSKEAFDRLVRYQSDSHYVITEKLKETMGGKSDITIKDVEIEEC